MKDFFQFREQQLNEFNLRKAFATAGKKISNLVKRGMKKLNWGRKVTIKVDIGSYLKESMEAEGIFLSEAKLTKNQQKISASLRKVNGDYAELLTAYHIAKIYPNKKNPSIASQMQKDADVIKDRMKKTVEKGQLVHEIVPLTDKDVRVTTQMYNKAIASSERNAPILAKMILRDIRGEDPALYDSGILEITPVHTGRDMGQNKTGSKADLRVEVFCPTSGKVVNEILASIKSYANRAKIGEGTGSTYPKMLQKLFMDGKGPTKGEAFIEAFAKRYPYKNVKRDLALVMTAGNPFKKERDEVWYWKSTGKPITTDEMDTEAYKWNRQGSLAMKRIFDQAYKSNKKKTNESVLKILNLKTDDTLYGVYGDITTETLKDSPRLQRLKDDLEKGFDLEMEIGDSVSGSGKLTFKHKDEVIFVADVESGSRSGGGKGSFAIGVTDMKSYLSIPYELKPDKESGQYGAPLPSSGENKKTQKQLRTKDGVTRSGKSVTSEPAPEDKPYTKDVPVTRTGKTRSGKSVSSTVVKKRDIKSRGNPQSSFDFNKDVNGTRRAPAKRATPEKKKTPNKERSAFDSQGTSKLMTMRDKDLKLQKGTAKFKQFNKDVRALTFDQLRQKYK